ncbi:MAG: hypothetical protein LBG57_02655 [Treponema sp.]|jgi:hypothetical protein|nr:hypothetical protein [Treponema sp.]
MLAKIERSVLFPLVRTVVFIGALVLLLTIVVALFFTLTYNGTKKKKNIISFSDVQTGINPAEDEANTQIIFPENVEEYLFTEENRPVLDRWLDSFEIDEEKNEFLENLSSIITSAETEDPDNVHTYINEYKRLYFEKISDREKELFGIPYYMEQKMPSLLTGMIRGTALVMICFLFGIFMNMVILLSLLSIERNTRKET